ncbi:uncharacterized protein LOC135463632 isoform X1 [Liolophura sinensis]|uniref:uncharacterized protein LOC135463632 isoform X1 n=1 Tax=Liolophura sinensis TaxID=3198878 RepID=UPI0031582985
MGVSLERVQFKFASIIGELCSEPIVLSQFAVWLDLRLAEYKSKGAISLDCSGEKPDPSWLKGLRTATAPAVKKVLGSRLAPRTGLGFSRGGMYSRSSAFHRRNVNSHSRMAQSGQGQTRSQTVTDMQSDVNNRLSGADTMGAVPHLSENTDDIVVIKDEPSEDNQGGVFPVSLHSHQALEPDSRKRPARDSVSSDTQDSSTPFKVRKNPSEESPLNQSLISVLGSAFEDQNPEMPSGTNDSATVSDMDYSASLQDQSDQSANIQWADNSTNFQSSAQPTTSTSTFSPNRPSATVTSNSSLAEGSISMDTLDQSELNESVQEPGRFKPTTESRLQELASKRFDRTTGKQTKWGVHVFKDWLAETNTSRDFEGLTSTELNILLRRFYAEARSKRGECYSKSALIGIRASINRYLNSPPFERNINIMNDREFVMSNNVLAGIIKEKCRDGKDITVHHKPISETDLRRLYSSGTLSNSSPKSLVRKVWFEISLHFGRDGLRDLSASSFDFKFDDAGVEYAEILYSKRNKMYRDSVRHPRMYATGDDTCPVKSLKLYLKRRNSHCEYFFQRPLTNFPVLADTDTICDRPSPWYASQAMGFKTQRTLMADISKDANLSRRYTNLCVSATATSLFADAGLSVSDVMSVTGHQSESSVRSYVNKPSVDNHREMSNILHSSQSKVRSASSSVSLQPAPTLYTVNTKCEALSIENDSDPDNDRQISGVKAENLP